MAEKKTMIEKDCDKDCKCDGRDKTKDITVIFTEEEMIACLQLIDIAVKAHGLQVAEMAVYFQRKFIESKQGNI